MFCNSERLGNPGHTTDSVSLISFPNFFKWLSMDLGVVPNLFVTTGITLIGTWQKFNSKFNSTFQLTCWILILFDLPILFKLNAAVIYDSKINNVTFFIFYNYCHITTCVSVTWPVCTWMSHNFSQKSFSFNASGNCS